MENHFLSSSSNNQNEAKQAGMHGKDYTIMKVGDNVRPTFAANRNQEPTLVADDDDDDNQSGIVGATICFTPETSPRASPKQDAVINREVNPLVHHSEINTTSTDTDNYIGSVEANSKLGNSLMHVASSLDDRSTTEYEIIDGISSKGTIEVEELDLESDEIEEDEGNVGDAVKGRAKAGSDRNASCNDMAAMLEMFDGDSPSSTLPSLNSGSGGDIKDIPEVPNLSTDSLSKNLSSTSADEIATLKNFQPSSNEINPPSSAQSGTSFIITAKSMLGRMSNFEVDVAEEDVSATDDNAKESPKVDDTPLTPFKNLKSFWETQSTFTHMTKSVVNRILGREMPKVESVEEGQDATDFSIKTTPADASAGLPADLVRNSKYSGTADEANDSFISPPRAPCDTAAQVKQVGVPEMQFGDALERKLGELELADPSDGTKLDTTVQLSGIVNSPTLRVHEDGNASKTEDIATNDTPASARLSNVKVILFSVIVTVASFLASVGVVLCLWAFHLTSSLIATTKSLIVHVLNNHALKNTAVISEAKDDVVDAENDAEIESSRMNLSSLFSDEAPAMQPGVELLRQLAKSSSDNSTTDVQQETEEGETAKQQEPVTKVPALLSEFNKRYARLHSTGAYAIALTSFLLVVMVHAFVHYVGLQQHKGYDAEYFASMEHRCISTNTTSFPSVPVYQINLAPAVSVEEGETIYGYTFSGLGLPKLAVIMSVVISFICAASTKPIKFKMPKSSRTVAPTSTRLIGIWTAEEHLQFIIGFNKHGNKWKLVAEYIPSRTYGQVRTHGSHWVKIGSPQVMNKSRRITSPPYDTPKTSNKTKSVKIEHVKSEQVLSNANTTPRGKVRVNAKQARSEHKPTTSKSKNSSRRSM